ncbi:Inactive peptidyl-prolyl cis-trans isomerase FKBP6, partial [Eschrichtius robustus]|nr:Inactive peptidyl-prolyl cis-trans isomerase FKBP6 [Eschrichtius robustus]
ALLLLHRRSVPLEEQHVVETAKLLVLLNLSFTYLKLEQPAVALRYGEQALSIDQKNAKALFRCGQACLLMTEYQKARDFLVRAQKEQPFNHDINNELKKLARSKHPKEVASVTFRKGSVLRIFFPARHQLRTAVLN